MAGHVSMLVKIANERNGTGKERGSVRKKKNKRKKRVDICVKERKGLECRWVTPTCECINKVNEMLDIEDEEVSLNIKVIQMNRCE